MTVGNFTYNSKPLVVINSIVKILAKTKRAWIHKILIQKMTCDSLPLKWYLQFMIKQ